MLAAVAVEMPVAQMLKLHLSLVKVSVAVVAGADDHILQPCFGCCQEASQPRFLMSESLSLLILHLQGQVVTEGCTFCLLLLPEK